MESRRWRYGGLFAALLFWIGLAGAAPPVAPVAPPTVVKAEFGIFEPGKDGELDFIPGAVVPRREGQIYGWVIELRGARRTVAVREEYLLPSTISPDDPAVREGRLIPLPRRVQVSQRQLVPIAGRIYGEWAVGPGEPEGHRHLQVIVEGELAGDFEFDVRHNGAKR
jgi:hypothetical protein